MQAAPVGLSAVAWIASLKFKRRGCNAMPNAAESPLATYIAHLKRGELGYQFSPSAAQAVFYPRVIAPKTGAADLCR